MTSCVGSFMRCVAVLAVVLAAAPARAELWWSSLGDLLTSAPTIEVVRVDKVVDVKIEGVVVEAVRGARAGNHVEVTLGALASPAVGDRVLVICDRYECPRAAAIDRGGWFQLTAQQPGDGAFVSPNVVERGSLAGLANGRPAPDLCVAGPVSLLDEQAAPAISAIVAAGDGKGTGTLTLGKTKRKLIAGLHTASTEPGIALHVTGPAALELVAETVTRNPEGCFTGAFVPVRPFARTLRSLVRALDGRMTTTLIARATLEVPKGTPVAAGTHALELSIDDNGQLVLASDLASGQVESITRDHGTLAVGFPSRTGTGFYPELQIDLGASAGDEPGIGAAAAFVLAHAKTVRVRWVPEVGAPVLLGTAPVTYVRER